MQEDPYKPLLDALAAMPRRLNEALASVPDTRWRHKPQPDRFSLLEQACHLRDLELEGYQPRIRRLLAEDLPTLHEIDGSAWALERDYQSQSLPGALRAFADARSATVALLREALPRHAQRKAMFGGFGIITLAGLAREMAAHDAQHWQEIAPLIG
jgi:hypothetical protein